MTAKPPTPTDSLLDELLGIADEFHARSRTDAIGREVPRVACAECERIQRAGFGPSHNGARACRMGRSIASGGDLAHCSCAGCF